MPATINPVSGKIDMIGDSGLTEEEANALYFKKTNAGSPEVPNYYAGEIINMGELSITFGAPESAEFHFFDGCSLGDDINLGFTAVRYTGFDPNAATGIRFVGNDKDANRKANFMIGMPFVPDADGAIDLGDPVHPYWTDAQFAIANSDPSGTIPLRFKDAHFTGDGNFGGNGNVGAILTVGTRGVTDGRIKIYNANNNYYNIFFPSASQSDNALYYLPPALPTSSGQALLCADDGTMSWETIDLSSYLPLTGGTLTGDLTIGSTSAGKNETINATLGSEISPAITAANWDGDGSGGWATITDGTLKKTGDGFSSVSPHTALSISVGTTYKVTIVASSASGEFYVYLGGQYSRLIFSSAGTYTASITALTTDDLTIGTYVNTSRCVITSVSVIPYIDATGDLSVGGDLTIKGITNRSLVYMNTNGKLAEIPYAYYDAALGKVIINDLLAIALSTDMDFTVNGNLYCGEATFAGVTHINGNAMWTDYEPLLMGQAQYSFSIYNGHVGFTDLDPTDQEGYFYVGTDLDMKWYHDGTDAYLNNTTGDIKLSCGANKTLELQNVVYKDINLASALLNKPASGYPDIDEFVNESGADTGIETYAFAPTEKVSGGFEIQHDYKEGTDLTFHVHWQGIAAPAGGTDNVKWQLIYTVSRDGTTLDATTTVVKESAITTRYSFNRSDFTAITGTNFKIGDQFLFQLSRIAASSDEYGGDALLATCGVHYQIDTLGSRSIAAK